LLLRCDAVVVPTLHYKAVFTVIYNHPAIAS